MISVINVDQFIRQENLRGPVTSPQLFMGKSMSFHPDGVFSEEIFGMEGSPESKNAMSWIELNCNVIHPSIYDMLTKSIERKISSLISLDAQFKIDDSGNLVEDAEGDISGFSNLVKNIDKIKFRRSDEESQRNQIIEMLEHNISKGTFFMNKLIVISPNNRPVTLGEDARDTMIDEMNELYTRVITLSNQMKGLSGTMFDVLSFKMQLAIKDMFDYVKTKVAKKQGIIRNQLLGKRVDFSARAVISPNPSLRLGETGIPIAMACSIFEPYLLYGLINSKESAQIPEEFHTALREFLGKEVDPEMIL